MGKTAGQHLDHTIEKTKRAYHKTKEHTKARWKPIIAIILTIVFFAVIITTCTGGKHGTTKDAQEMAAMLKKANVTIQYIDVTRDGYAITYAAESATDRFDDALLYDWGTIYGTAAAFPCDRVSIITTLDGQEVHKQTASCDAILALKRRVLTETEFWSLVEHKSLG